MHRHSAPVDEIPILGCVCGRFKGLTRPRDWLLSRASRAGIRQFHRTLSSLTRMAYAIRVTYGHRYFHIEALRNCWPNRPAVRTLSH